MKLELQVTSLSLSKKLKELGIKQESYFVYCEYRGDVNLWKNDSLIADEWKKTAAFTFAELWEILPKFISGYGHLILQGEGSGTYLYYADHKEKPYIGNMANQNITDIAARMIIYLIENKLWKI